MTKKCSKRFKKLKKKIKRHENQLTVEKIELEELQAENMVQKNDVEALRVKKENEILSIQEDKELILQEIQMMEKEQEERDKMIEELIKLYADSTILFGGDLDWPVPGWTRISSKFGPRIHPVHGYRSTHTGIDIPASYGTSVKAAGSGRVIFAGWGTAYGNFILIDHGVDPQKRHVVTQYAHNSELLVSEGDVVVRGETIAKVGSTGWSTGNHLHFGVQIGASGWIHCKKHQQTKARIEGMHEKSSFFIGLASGMILILALQFVFNAFYPLRYVLQEVVSEYTNQEYESFETKVEDVIGN